MNKNTESPEKSEELQVKSKPKKLDATLDEIVNDINATTTVNKGKTSKKQEIFQFLKFLGFSLSAGVIQLGLFELLCHVIGWYYWPSYLISLIASVVWNFTFNRKFTFKSANNVPIAMLLVLGYYAVFTPLSTWWSNVLVHNVGWNETLVTLFSMIINFVTEFLFDRYVVFRKSINTNDLKLKKQKKLALQTSEALAKRAELELTSKQALDCNKVEAVEKSKTDI